MNHYSEGLLTTDDSDCTDDPLYPLDPCSFCHLEPPIVVISSPPSLSSRACREIFFYLSFSRSLRENFSSTFLRREESSKEAFPHPRPSPRGRMQTGVADARRLPCLFGIAGHAIFSLTSLLSPSLGKGLTGPRRMFLSAGA